MPLALKSRMQLRGSDNRRATEMSAAEYFCLIEANHRPSAGGKPKFLRTFVGMDTKGCRCVLASSAGGDLHFIHSPGAIAGYLPTVRSAMLRPPAVPRDAKCLPQSIL